MMFNFYFTRLSVLNKNIGSRAIFHSKPRPGILHFGTDFVKIRSFSSDAVVSYLINSCGLTPRSAQTVSKRVHFDTPEKPDAVLNLLREHGFTTAHISRLVRDRPQLLKAQPEKTLLPKLEFLRPLGVPSSDFHRIVCMNPRLLVVSLDHALVPIYNFMKSILGSDKRVVRSLGRLGRFAAPGTYLKLQTNILLLREVGVPQSVIFYLLSSQPILACCEPDRFNQKVRKVIELGFDPYKFSFVPALRGISSLTGRTRECKMEVFMRWGLSEDQVWAVFRKYPQLMVTSEKKITGTMDFLVNKMGWQVLDVASAPYVLSYSLENWIVPRCSVIRVLQLKGLLQKEIHLSSVSLSEKQFLKLFVVKYQEEVPQLFSILRGEIIIEENYFELVGKQSRFGNL